MQICVNNVAYLVHEQARTSRLAAGLLAGASNHVSVFKVVWLRKFIFERHLIFYKYL